MSDTPRRWTVGDVAEIEHLIHIGMAYAIWEDAITSAIEESRQPDGDPGMTEVLQGVDRTEPEDAANTCADDLRKLYAAANGTAAPADNVDNKDADLALEVANDAVETEGRDEDAEQAFAQVPAPMFLLARKASQAMGLPHDEMMSDTDLHDFGYYMYMEAVGHGVSWSDNHKSFRHRKPYFESHLIGTMLSWSGNTRLGRALGGHGAVPYEQRELSVSGDQKTSIEYTDPGTRTIRRIETRMDAVEDDNGDTGFGDAEVVDDDEVALDAPDRDNGETWSTVAVKYLRRQGTTEPSASSFFSSVWYSAEAQQDFRTGALTEVTCHLGDDFTDEERREIFDAMNT